MRLGILGLAVLPAAMALSVAAEAWTIRDFVVTATVDRNGSFAVREEITVDFGTEQRHGIFRDILVKERDRFGSARSLRVDVRSVTDGAGQLRPYKAFRTGRYHRIKVGEANSYVTGVQRYVMTYGVRNGLLFFPDHDEFYWNATGDEWAVPIEHASCTVQLPAAVDPQKIQTAGFQGARGSTERTTARAAGTGAWFETTRPLSLSEGLTVAVGWPKGHVAEPSTAQRVAWFVTDNLFAFLPVVFLLGFVFLWRSAGRDPDIGMSEAVQYQPPDGLRPAEMGTLIDESADVSDITSTVIDLAVRGYLTITEVPPEGWFDRTSYVLEKTPEDTRKPDLRGGLSAYEEDIFGKLFSFGDVVNTKQLKDHFYTIIKPVKTELYSSLVKRKYFRSRPDSVRDGYYALGVALLIAGVVLAVVMAAAGESGGAMMAPGWGVAVAVCGLITLMFAKAMPRKTPAGRRAFLEIRGFEEYLKRAESRDIALQEEKGLFEKFLPYAICLGVADHWARAFEGIYTTPPDWYRGGSDGVAFHPIYFSNSLNGAMNHMGTVMTSAPRAASSGGSGFGGGGGGGFSGGGFGGGGGGAW